MCAGEQTPRLRGGKIRGVSFDQTPTKGRIMNKSVTVFLAAAGLAFSVSAMADPTSRHEYKDALKAADADYNAARANCPTEHAEKIACRRDALAARDKARGDAREAHGLPRHQEGPRL
jgi:hypothetical protein